MIMLAKQLTWERERVSKREERIYALREGRGGESKNKISEGFRPQDFIHLSNKGEGERGSYEKHITPYRV